MSGIESMTVVGSAALDTIETPHGRVEDVLGGSAFYICAAGSMFCMVNPVAVVGDDFDMERLAFLQDRDISLEGLEVADGPTFRWEGFYHENMNQRDTISTELGVFEGFSPKLPVDAANTNFLLLANIDPELQLDVLNQVQDPKLVAFDTMNLWIEIAREKVIEVISRVDVVTLNDEEISMLTGCSNLMEAANQVLAMGPSYVVVKKGEHGSMLITADEPPFISPAFPVQQAIDPTGAGDTFAGAMIGYLAATDDLSAFNMRQAIVYGNVTASFAVEDFGLRRLEQLTTMEVEERLREYRAMLEF